MPLVSVSVPGPWWTSLSYQSEKELTCGLRVLVPLGRSHRVGLTIPAEDYPDGVKNIKEIKNVIDEHPSLPDELWATINWFGRTWFAGTGMAAKTLLPAKFFDGESLEPFSQVESAACAPDVRYCYEPRDRDRYDYYAQLLNSSKNGALIIFPEVIPAKMFWDNLPASLRDEGALWPATGVKKQWDLWKKSRAGEIKFIVGAQGASFAPLAGLSMIIVEDESSGAWRTQKHPIFHRRTLLAARAQNAKAGLVLGGRMPSAKVFQQGGADLVKNSVSIKNRLIFVDLRDSSNMEIAAVKDPLPISRPLIRETVESRKRGEWVFWLLDRKGYAGEIYCTDCGNSVRCARCGGIMRWEGKSGVLRCMNCESRSSMPDRCPVCGGPFLEGHRPGLTALAECASSLLKYRCGDILSFQEEGDRIPSAVTLLKERPDGAVVVGTRRILALADALSPGMIGWIDADAEARTSEYDARTKAFSLIWESMWRGGGLDGRKVIIQSRRPDRGWQKGLSSGWRLFWRGELRERKELGLPPFLPMLKIKMPKGKGEALSSALDTGGFEYWEAEENSDEIWVRTRRFDSLRELLEPYYHIRCARTGFPCVEISLD